VKASGAVINADFSLVESIRFNRVYMGSVFLNLITNSIKYAQPGIAPAINIHSTIVKGKDQLIFSDNGIGFDMEVVKDKIFGLHQKFHDHNDSKGIGLYLINNHVNSMGGHIAVNSIVNKGTTFTISFN
jgi:signal transduction histidine kinase